MKHWRKAGITCLLMIGVLVVTSVSRAALPLPTPTPAPRISLKAYGITDYQRNTPLYMIVLKVTGEPAAKYVIERQTAGSAKRISLMEKTYEQLQQTNFELTDFGTLEKHQQYEYFLTATDPARSIVAAVSVKCRVANLKYKEDMNKFWPVFSGNNATFTLGPPVDPEADGLEYRLYTRIPGGGDEKIYRSWRPTQDNQRVIVNFTNSCEWRLVCIEVDPKIVDRSESVLIDWSSFIKE